MQVLGSCWGLEGREKEGLRQLSSANSNICGVTTSEIHRGPQWLSPRLVSSMAKMLGYFAEQVPVALDSYVALCSYFYLSLYVSALPVSGWGEMR